MNISPEHLIPFFGEEDNRCIHLCSANQLQLENPPSHATFLSHSSVSRNDCVEMACISEMNQVHIWLGGQYRNSIVSDDVVVSLQPYIETELGYATLFIVTDKLVRWFVCGQEEWILVWSYPTNQPALSISPNLDTENKTYSVYILFPNTLLCVTNLLIESRDTFEINSENANFTTSPIQISPENVQILSASYLEDSLLICTTTTLSLRKLSSLDHSISYEPVSEESATIKDCIFMPERCLSILLTDNGTVEFVDSQTLTLTDEWSSFRIEAIALLADEEEYFLVCQRTDDQNSVLDVISLQNLEVVATRANQDSYHLILSRSISEKFSFYTILEDNILQMNFCHLSHITKKADLERTMVDFSQLQVCLEKGFDWVTEIIDDIHGSQFQSACYLWWKHSESVQLELTSSIFSLLLNKIAVTDNTEGIVLWLESLILFVTLQGNGKQSYLTLFLEWIETFIDKLEKYFPENWTQLALRLANFLCAEISAIDSWETSKQLVIIKNQLEDIQIVFSTLNIRLSFSRISEYSLSSFLHQLLRHAHSPDHIRTLLTSKIISIINRHGETLDNVLFKYVQSLSGKFNQEAYLADILESKAITVVQHISSNDLKHKSVLFLLRHARLPLNKKLLEFAHEVENTTRISMKYEIQLAETLSVLKEHSIDANGVLFSAHQVMATLQTILSSGRDVNVSRSIKSVSGYADVSDDITSFFLNSQQLLCSGDVLDENAHFEPFYLIPSILIALLTEEYLQIESCELLGYLTKLRTSLFAVERVTTYKIEFYQAYFENLFKAVYLHLNFSQSHEELTIPFLLNSPPPISAYSSVIAILPEVLERDPGLSSPSKRVKIAPDSTEFFTNFHQLHRSHRLDIYSGLIKSAIESLDIKQAILLINLRIRNEGLSDWNEVSEFLSRILSKFSVTLSILSEPIELLNQVKELVCLCSVAIPRGSLSDFTKFLMRIRLTKDIIFQSEYEIKPRHSQQQQKENRKLFRNHFYQEKGFILDKNSATACIASLSTRDKISSPGPSETATALLILKNSFLPQTSLSILLHCLYSTPSLMASPTLHNIPSSLLTSLLRASPLDVTYTLALILSLHEEEGLRELSVCCKKVTSSLSWYASIAWIGLWYQELVQFNNFKSFAINALSTAQYIGLIRSVTRQNIEVQSNQWTPEFILKRLRSPSFPPVHTLRAAEMFGLDADRELLLWVKTAIQFNIDTDLIKQGLCLIERRFESLQSLYESGEVSNYRGIKFVLDSLTQLEKPSNAQLKLNNAICLVTFLISSNAPFLSKCTQNADTTSDTEFNTSLLTSDHLTFNDLLGDNPWSLIKDFLSFQNLDIYLGLTAYLDLNRDHIISTTIKTEVTNCSSTSRSISIQEVRPYLERLGTRKMQIAASNWLGSNMLHIEDRLGAIYFAIESADRWKNECSVVEIQEASEAHDKLQAYYKLLRVSMWLDELGMGERNSSQLCQSPRELIRVITNTYQPETIYQCSKLYGIIRDICSLFSLEIDCVISDSISSLISNQKETKDLNSSFSFYIEGDVEDMNESLNITGNVYTQLIVLLSSLSQDIGLHVNNLVNIAIRDINAHSYSNRKAAIQLAIILTSHYSQRKICFNRIVLDTFTQMQSQFASPSNREMGENYGEYLRMLLDLLCIVEDLELLGYRMGIGTFLQSNKHAVIQGLVRNFADSFQAFELSARIGILLLSKLSESIWEEMLTNLNKYQRYAFLLSLLPKLGRILSHSFLKPLHLVVLTHIELSEHLNLFPQFIQLAHSTTDFSPSDRQVFIYSICKSIDCLKKVGKGSYAQILEHLVQSLNDA